MDLHRRLVKEVACVVDLGRVRLDLTLDLTFQDVDENDSSMLMHGGFIPWRERGDEQRHFRFAGFTQRLLHKRLSVQ